MSAKKTADQWFTEYGESHPPRGAALLHWVCLPLIFFSVLGFIWTIPVPDLLAEHLPGFNWTLIAMAAAMLFYASLSPRLSAGLLFFMAVCYSTIVVIEFYDFFPVWKICTTVFVVAGIGRFIGLCIAGKKPSLLKETAFLLIGPAWLMSVVYRKLGQTY